MSDLHAVSVVLHVTYTLCMRTYSGGLLVSEDLRVDPVELQDEFVHQLRVQSPLSFEEGTVLYQLLVKTVCPR